MNFEVGAKNFAGITTIYFQRGFTDGKNVLSPKSIHVICSVNSRDFLEHHICKCNSAV